MSELPETLRINLNLLSSFTIAFILKNGLPLNEGFEETIAPMVMENLLVYYADHDMVLDLVDNELDPDAISYAFARVQETTDMVQASVRMMTGGGLN